MKRTNFFLLALVTGWAVGAGGSLAASVGLLPVAVFDFEAKDPGVADLGPKVSTLLNATLSAEESLITVERAELAKVLGEQELALSGTVSAETAAKVGQLTGAKVLVTGRIFRVEQETIIVAKIISVETSRVYGEIVKGNEPAPDLVSKLTAKIAAVLRDKADTLVAKTEPREQRLAKLRDRLGEGRRPSVFVRLPERHYGAAANDPAAETELMKLLKLTGFTVVDTESKAEVVISGEAFSAAAARKGNLHVCKARVEAKAVATKRGEVLAIDRETSVAVDVAEQTAGKTALQQAAENLGLRLLPSLVK